MSNTVIQPYLTFGGRCEEALEFYKSALGAEVDMIMYFRDCPDPMPPGMLPEGYENKVMHSSFRIAGNVIMASDGCDVGANFAGFTLSVSVPAEADADRVFNALVDGGKVTMPLGKTFWSPRFGMLTDKFGVSWMVNVSAEEGCG